MDAGYVLKEGHTGFDEEHEEERPERLQSIWCEQLERQDGREMKAETM